jgi:hypothetical protein
MDEMNHQDVEMTLQEKSEGQVNDESEQDDMTTVQLGVDGVGESSQQVVRQRKSSKLNSIYGHETFYQKIADNKILKRMYQLDVLKAPIYDPKSHNNNTFAYTVLFYASVLIYAIYATINFVNRPEQTTFLLRETKELPLQYLRMEIQCTTPWGCFKSPRKVTNQTTGRTWWKWDASPWIKSTYSDGNNNMGRIDIGGKFTKKNVTNVPLKFSNTANDGILIKVPDYWVSAQSNNNCSMYGSSCAPVLKIKILANDLSTGGPMQINMDLEPHQRKAVYIGVILRENDDPNIETSYELFNQDLFYVGKNVSSVYAPIPILINLSLTAVFFFFTPRPTEWKGSFFGNKDGSVCTSL